VALGIVMANRRITSERALDLLRQTSRRSNRKLRDVAADVVETGQIPSNGG
jgi:AmiR/NasT family two-component response regulator